MAITCVGTKTRLATIAAITLAIVFSLTGCGHKGPLKVPEPAPTQAKLQR